MALPTYFELIPAFQQFIDGNGNPLVNGTIETYIAGTSTPKATFRESDGAVSNGATITLDSSGYTPYGVWGTAGAYKVILKNSSGATLRTRDNVRSINDITRNGLILIQSQTASNSATINFTTGFTSYNNYQLIVSDVVPATDNDTLVLRTSSDGVNFDNGANDYSWANGSQTPGGGAASSGSANDTGIALVGGMGSSTGENMRIVISFGSPSSSLYKLFHVAAAGYNATPTLIEVHGGGVRKSSSVLRGLRFFAAAGNISSGRFDFYGIAD